LKASQKYEVIGMGVRTDFIQLVLRLEAKSQKPSQPMTSQIWIDKKTYERLKPLNLYSKIKVIFQK